MKICEYCDSPLDDDAVRCPQCGAYSFSGTPQKVAATPQREVINLDPPATERSSGFDADEFTGTWWKVALTVFFPVVGGYFLLRPNAPFGARLFGVLWCVMLGVVGFFAGSDGDLAIDLFVSALFLAPVVVYVIRKLKARGEGSRLFDLADALGLALGIVAGYYVVIS